MQPATAQCDFCTLFIPSHAPRLQCLTCPNYDLCAPCALGSKFNRAHLLSHPTQIYSISGDQDVQPVMSDDLSLVYAVPVIPMMSLLSPSPDSESPPIPIPAPSTSTPTPPIPSSRRTRSSRHSQSPPPTRSSAPPPISPPSPPTLPALVPTERSSSRRRSRASSSKWSPLFDSEMEVTELGETFFSAIFSHLDPSYSGYLTPEAYSGFLDALGYKLHENVWKNSLIHAPASSGQPKETMADKALRNAYDLFSIEHVLKNRPTSAPSYSHTGAKISSKMPLLTLKGFIEICAVEILCDPQREWANLQRALKRYRLRRFLGWGELPRDVLPEDADPRMQERVKIVSQFARARDEQLVAMEEQFDAQAERKAIDLVDDRRFCYRSD